MKHEIVSLFRKAIGPILLQNGFRRGKDNAFERSVSDDITQYVAIYNVDTYECAGVFLQVEFCVLSERLFSLSFPDLPRKWSYAPVRATLAAVDTGKPNVSSGLCIESESDIEHAAEEFSCVLLAKALPFLNAVGDAQDIIQLHEDNHFSTCHVSAVRSAYDLAVWKGMIDPERTPITEWLASKSEPSDA